MKVINVDFAARSKKKQEPELPEVPGTWMNKDILEEHKEDNSLDSLAKVNEANKARMEKERNKANKDVLRSYRIK